MDIIAIGASIGVAVGLGVLTYISKMQKGEKFDAQKLIKSGIVGALIGGIASTSGYTLTAENYQSYLVTNAGAVAIAYQLVNLSIRTIKEKL